MQMETNLAAVRSLVTWLSHPEASNLPNQLELVISEESLHAIKEGEKGRERGRRREREEERREKVRARERKCIITTATRYRNSPSISLLSEARMMLGGSIFPCSTFHCG